MNKPPIAVHRGDVVTVVAPGNYGKPRPALVVQADLFNTAHTSVTVCLMTSECCELPACRISLEPDAGNGLRVPSQIQVDRLTTLPWEKLGGRIGKVNDETLLQVSRALAVWLGMA